MGNLTLIGLTNLSDAAVKSLSGKSGKIDGEEPKDWAEFNDWS